MKIVKSIQDYYKQEITNYEQLKKYIDDEIKVIKKESWHYYSRIKLLESFALKLENGREDLNSIKHDIFACTLVVESSANIESALKIIKKRFIVDYRKPKTKDFTHKDPNSFPFDDLRLYIKLRKNNSLPEDHISNRFSNIVFELQIKTFLQHAWTIATHDLIYKNKDISWAKQRVAYQIKAMLEHAEISISEINALTTCTDLNKQNKKIKQLGKIKEFLKTYWDEERLPDDLIRQSENVLELINKLNINLDELIRIIENENKLNRGSKTLNLSPYLSIIQSIIYQNPELIKKFLLKSKKEKIFISNDVDLTDINKKSGNLIFLK